MKTCKMAMAACGAVLAGVVYGCIAGFCPRGDAVICAAMMALCLAYCRASMIYRKRRRQRADVAHPDRDRFSVVEKSARIFLLGLTQIQARQQGSRLFLHGKHKSYFSFHAKPPFFLLSEYIKPLRK